MSLTRAAKNADSERRNFLACRLIQSLYRQSVSEAQAAVSVLLLVLTLASSKLILQYIWRSVILPCSGKTDRLCL